MVNQSAPPEPRQARQVQVLLVIKGCAHASWTSAQRELQAAA